MKLSKFGGYRIGSNIPVNQGAVWENVARVARWGAPVIELNTDAEMLGSQALEAVKQIDQANDIVYTWHIPPDARQSGELAVPNDPRQNEFARRVMEQAIKSAAEVNARHITFHATLSAGRLDKSKMYVYDARQNQVGVQPIIEGLSKEESVKLLNESAKAQLRTQFNQLESNKALVSGLAKTARKVKDLGVSDANAWEMAYLADQAERFGQMVRVSAEDVSIWSRIKEKAARRQSLTSEERAVIKRYSNRVLQQVNDYRQQITAQITQLKPWVSDNKDLVMDGERQMIQNVAENIAALDKGVLKTAVNKGVSLGFENLGANQLFSTPQELNDLREVTINKLVGSGKLSRAEAEQLIGFTFDIAHSNTTKYVDIEGKKFASPSEFIEQLKGPVKHVHATDSVGIVDSHLPLGQGELTKEEFNKIKEALERSGFKHTAVHELGRAQIPVLYGSSMEWVEGGGYMTGAPGSAGSWGPTYLGASMTDPLMLGQDRGYFYESFVDIY